MIVQLRHPRPPSPQYDLQSAIVRWLADLPANVIDDMKLLHAEREASADLLSRADALRSELNEQIAKANAHEALLDGRESSLQRREAAVAGREAVIAVLRAELAGAP
jgi:hypothetical protein